MFNKMLVILILFTSSFLMNGQNKNEFRKTDNEAFRVGEKLTFDVKYGFVTAGIATMAPTRGRRPKRAQSHSGENR